ncbi:MAG TPA: FAD-dependent oxidoreductase [Pyrinomonadaceae bacterium]|nr:FAD-dependent oxidoreductase [Pyrinomonadaceae bacterium]
MNRYEIDRRNFLRRGLAASVIAVASPAFPLRGFTSQPNLITRASPPVPLRLFQQQPLPRVKVARERVIREVVGLRPFRPQGFMVAAEKMGPKLLVHNYGHGGAGITLSWGTASLAVDLAQDFIQLRSQPLRRAARGPTTFAVLGCGVSGLSTARLLQQRYADGSSNVTIYARNLPPDTTSNVAGGFWSPTSVFDASEATTVFTDQFAKACKISNRAFQTLVGPEYGVRWIRTLELLRNEASLEGELTGGNNLYAQVEVHREPQNYFGFPVAREFSTMLIEPHTYLRALIRDFYAAGGKIVVKDFKNREQVARLRQQVVFNCTGLGARDLMKDQNLVPVRGQLEVLLPQPEIDYCYLANSAYMFPRKDGIVLGGTWGHDDWRLEPDPQHTSRILGLHEAIMKG